MTGCYVPLPRIITATIYSTIVEVVVVVVVVGMLTTTIIIMFISIQGI